MAKEIRSLSETGVIPIGKEGNRVNWKKVQAEYLGGGISQRKLAAKYNISVGTMLDRANREGWAKQREQVYNDSIAKSEQKAAEAIADNATIAAELKKNLLLRLKRIEEKYPVDATEVRTRQGNSTAIFRIRDLTAAYKDITEDIQTGTNATNELLESLIRLERGLS